MQVKSSNAQAAEYNAETQTLTVQFRNGSVYEYAKFPQDLYEQMVNSDSAGKFLWTHVVGKFEAQKIG